MNKLNITYTLVIIYIIDLSKKVDYKKSNLYSNEHYRQQFLQLFYLSDFDNDIINKKIIELYDSIVDTKRITPEFDQLLNKDTLIFGMNSQNQKTNRITKLKFLFSYDTMDLFIPYLHAMMSYDDETWNNTNEVLFKPLRKEMNNLIM